MTIITIAAAGIATVLLAVQLKGLKGEYAAYMVMAAGAFIFFYGTGKLKDILEALERIQGYIKVNSVYLVTLLKMVVSPMWPNLRQESARTQGTVPWETRLKYSESCLFWGSVCPFCWHFLGHWRHFWDEEMDEMGSQERGSMGACGAVCRCPGMDRQPCLRRFGGRAAGGTAGRTAAGAAAGTVAGTAGRAVAGTAGSSGHRDRRGPGIAGYGASG